jgi:uncharacterized protein YjbI with pentapeptide repeats
VQKFANMVNTASKNLDQLYSGFAIWNDYRMHEDFPPGKIDLTHLEIEGSLWRFNELKNADLSHCDFEGTNFKDIDFLGVDFTNSAFTRSIFSNVRFTKCVFSNTSFEEIVLDETSWYHSEFRQVDLSKIKSFKNISFYKCSFPKDVLEIAKRSPELFEDCSFDRD